LKNRSRNKDKSVTPNTQIHDYSLSLLDLNIYIYIFYSETTPLQRGQTSAGYQCLLQIITNKQLY